MSQSEGERDIEDRVKESEVLTGRPGRRFVVERRGSLEVIGAGTRLGNLCPCLPKLLE